MILMMPSMSGTITANTMIGPDAPKSPVAVSGEGRSAAIVRVVTQVGISKSHNPDGRPVMTPTMSIIAI